MYNIYVEEKRKKEKENKKKEESQLKVRLILKKNEKLDDF